MVSVAASPTLNITSNTPHWRRTTQVYAILAQAPPEATYSQLIEAVRQATGKGCSRKLISRWKKEQTSSQKLKVKSQNGNKPPTDTPNFPSLIVTRNQPFDQLAVESKQTVNNETLVTDNCSLFTDSPSIQNPKSKIQNREVQNPQGWFKKIAVVGVAASNKKPSDLQ
jgi:hypothetical protein